MKECNNSTRTIHISSYLLLSISLLIMFDTLLLRPSLNCNTPLHFITLHSSTLHYTSLHFTIYIYIYSMYNRTLFLYKCMYVYTPALEAAAPIVFVVWLRAYLHRLVFTTFRTYALPTS